MIVAYMSITCLLYALMRSIGRIVSNKEYYHIFSYLVAMAVIDWVYLKIFENSEFWFFRLEQSLLLDVFSFVSFIMFATLPIRVLKRE